MRLILGLLMLVMAAGCASGTKEISSSKCVSHPRWGGPFEVVSIQGYMIVIRDPKTGNEEKVMKKDFVPASCSKS